MLQMEKRVSAMQARRQFGQLLEEVYYRNHDVVIERAGRPMAVLVSLDQYRRWQEQRDEVFAIIRDVQQKTSRVPGDELQTLIAEAVEAAKSEEIGLHEDRP